MLLSFLISEGEEWQCDGEAALLVNKAVNNGCKNASVINKKASATIGSSQKTENKAR